ncbi:hypothetical protein PLESTF_000046100 [Pleodorina starrii]|nr:hypothetical protein PLESTF_000046100 [Pleodorina starrii]
MNLVQTNLLREVAAEVKAQGGPLQFKSHALKNLELRTVLKESHGAPIVDLAFNSLDPEHRNLFASIGKDQVTIYDDEHMGDFLGVVVQYVNSPSAHHRGGDVTCCAWVQMCGITRHELGDACLAVSGPEGVIQVISVVEARVVALLKGHRGEVVELRGCAGVPGLLLSLGLDGSVRLWDVAAGGSCLAELTAPDALTLETHPEGRCFYTGHRGGRICRWELDLDLPGTLAAGTAAPGSSLPGVTATGDATAPTASSAILPGPAGQSGCRRLALRGAPPAPQQLTLPGNPLGDVLECVRCMPGGRLAAKSSDGRLAVWELERGGAAQQLLSLRVPGTHPAAGSGGQGAAAALRSGRCRFNVTRDGAFICVGNPGGDVYVYDTSSGARAAHYSTQKMRGPARAAALSEDGRHLLTVHGNGYILRYEYIRKQLRKRAAAAAAAADSAAPEAEDAAQAPQAQAGAEAPAPGDDVREGEGPGGGGGASSRDVSPEAFTEDDDGSAAVGPAAGAGGPAAPPAAKRLRTADGCDEASPSGGSGDDGGGHAAGGAECAGGRRLKLRVRFGGPRLGGAGGELVGDGGAGPSGGTGAVAGASMSGEGRENSPDGEWTGGFEEE